MSSNLPTRGGRRASGSTPPAPGAAATEGHRAEQSRERSSARTEARTAQREERRQAIDLGRGIGRAKDEVRASELGSSPPPAAGDDSSASPPRTARARQVLSSPRAARQAIVLREILGPPVSLRRGRSDVPGLSP
jgi:hypothetical protein